DELILRPLRAAFGPATRLLIAPDGDLSLVPFEALRDERGRFMIERYAISYLTSGRDLLRMPATRVASQPPVVVADPYFGEPGTPAHAGPAADPRIARRGSDEQPLYFAPLAATAQEAHAIKALFPDTRLFMGHRATKSSLEGVAGPRLLQIA